MLTSSLFCVVFALFSFMLSAEIITARSVEAAPTEHQYTATSVGVQTVALASGSFQGRGVTKTAQTTATLNVRSGPSTGYEILGALPRGTTVTILSEENGWALISLDSTIRESVGIDDDVQMYVSVLYLEILSAADESTDNSSTSEAPASTSAVITATSTVSSATELLAAAVNVFGEGVTVDSSFDQYDYPVAKIDKFVVGNFLEAEWQQIHELQPLSQAEVAYFPSTVEKRLSNGTRVLVQKALGKEVQIAVWDEEEEGWYRPTKSAYELTTIALERDVKSKKVSKTVEEAEANINPTPYGYNVSVRPDIVEGEPQKSRTLPIRAIVNSGFQVMHFPIRLTDENGETTDTQWKLRLLLLPISSVDEGGNWYTDYLIVSATQPLIHKNKSYWPEFIDEATSSDTVLYSTLPNGFDEFNIWSRSLPLTPAAETDIEDGDAVAIYMYSVTLEDSEQFRRDVAYAKDLLGNFLFQEDVTPNMDQINYAGTFLLAGLYAPASIPEISLLDDTIIAELIRNGSNLPNLKYYGGTSAVHKIIVEEREVDSATSEADVSGGVTETAQIVNEISVAQKVMDGWLPRNFREYYETEGGVMSFDEGLGFYQVTFGDNEFYLLPKAGSHEINDLEYGLFTLGEQASISNHSGTQKIRFFVSTEFPFVEQEIAVGQSTGAKFKLNPFWTSEETMPEFDGTYHDYSLDFLRRLYGYAEDETFDLSVVIGGTNANAARARDLGLNIIGSKTNQVHRVTGRVFRIDQGYGQIKEIVYLFLSENYDDKLFFDLSLYGFLLAWDVMSEPLTFLESARPGISIDDVGNEALFHIQAVMDELNAILTKQYEEGDMQPMLTLEVPSDTLQATMEASQD